MMMMNGHTPTACAMLQHNLCNHHFVAALAEIRERITDADRSGVVICKTKSLQRCDGMGGLLKIPRNTFTDRCLSYTLIPHAPVGILELALWKS